MKSFLLTLLMALSVGCVGIKPPASVENLRPAYLEAVKPLQVSTANREALQILLGRLGYQVGEIKGPYMNICTTSSINREAQLWITAAHCVRDVGPEGRFIEGQPADVVDVNYDTDIAVLIVPGYTAGHQLYRAVERPRWQQDVLIVGHPFGYDPVFITRGWIANPNGNIDNFPFMLLNVAAAPGNSGSPVINLKGEVVSILQIGWSREFSPVTGGATYDSLEKFGHHFATPAGFKGK